MKVFFAWSQTADVLCIKIHKQREKVRGGEHVDVRRNMTSCLYVAMKVNCLRVFRGVIQSADSVEKLFLNGNKRGKTYLHLSNRYSPLQPFDY